MYRDQFGEFVCGYWGLKVNVILVASSLLPSETKSKQDRCFLSHNLEFTQDGYRYLLCYTVNFVLTDTSIRRTPW